MKKTEPQKHNLNKTINKKEADPVGEFVGKFIAVCLWIVVICVGLFIIGVVILAVIKWAFMMVF